MQCVVRLVFGALCCLASLAAADEEPFQLGPIPKEGVLILRNGQAVAGSLTRAGDHFFAALPEGEIRLRADDVEMACRDLDEAYVRKRAVMPVGDAQRHIELAGWCLRHGLIGPAASELADAIRSNPAHPMIPLLRRHLETAMQPDEETAAPPPERLGPTRSDLDTLVRRLPPGTVEVFTAEVQPLLMNNCTSSGCHGPNSDHAFRLLRVPRSRPGGRRITQQNLYSVLQWIDREAPEKSKLLRVPIEPHGGMDRPVFSQRELGQLQQLSEWVNRLRAPPDREEVPATVQWPNHQPATPRPIPAPIAPGDAPSTPEQGPMPTSPAVEAFDESPRIQYGAPTPGFVPVDPFDPDIFNRQYFGDE